MIQLNHILLIFALVIIFSYLINNVEPFSSSGLSMSDRYCNKLVYIYGSGSDYDDMKVKYCQQPRRDTIDFPSGNYYTQFGRLI